MAPRYPAIPDPTNDPASLRDSVLALKQAFELLAGIRGDVGAASASDVANVSETVAGQATDIEALQSSLAALTYVSSLEGATGALTLNETSGIELSGSAVQLRQGSASQFGAVKVDNSTISATGGVLSVIPAGVSLTRTSAALGADVALNNTANYFDGPSLGTLAAGTWLVIASATVADSASTTFYAKLWDGTTVISSALASIPAIGNVVMTCSGIITNPSGAVRLSVRDAGTTGGLIKYNGTGNSKDSHITAVRIA